MAKKPIFNKTLTLRYGQTLDDPIGLSIGKTYVVVWNGVTYIGAAVSAVYNDMDVVVIGNVGLLGYEGGIECPFILGDTTNGSTSAFLLIDYDPEIEYTDINVVIYEANAIFPEQELRGFSLYGDTTYKNVLSSPISLENGIPYLIVWDGITYNKTAMEVESSSYIEGPETIIGNVGRFFDGPDYSSGEPFVIHGNIVYSFEEELSSSGVSHKVAIYEDPTGTILKQRNVQGFYLNQSLGYMYQDVPVLHLVEGKEYTVIWDDTEPWTCTAYRTIIPGYGDFVYVGDGTKFNAQGKGEPFVIASFVDGVCATTIGVGYLAFTDPASSHEIGIYLKENESDDSAEVNFFATVDISDINNGGMIPKTFELVVDENYIVVWDNVEYQCQAQGGDGAPIAIGNSSLFDGEDTKEPFLILDMSSSVGDIYMVTVPDSDLDDHIFSVYHNGDVLCSNVEVYPAGVGTYTGSLPDITVGKKYIVSVNGAQYNLTAEEINGLVVFGNPSMLTPAGIFDGVNNGLPFAIFFDFAGNMAGAPIMGIMNRSTETSVNISIQSDNGSVNPPEVEDEDYKFIFKENLEFTSDINNEQWSSVLTQDSLLGITNGKTYKVKWGSDEFELTAISVYNQKGLVYTLIGNMSYLDEDLDNNGLPFVIADIPLLNACGCVTRDETTTKIVAIYEKVIEDSPADDDEEDESEYEVILPKETRGFEWRTDYNAWVTVIPDTQISEDKIYKVKWDEDEFELKSTVYDSIVSLGNYSLINNSADTKEPFLFQNTDDGLLCVAQKGSIHSFAIYEYLAADGIVIRDPLGKAITYGEYKKILINRASGEKTIYSEGETIRGTIDLDFSQGDMSVKPERGFLWSKVSIPKPENLISSNILENVEIAGVKGTRKVPTSATKTVTAGNINFSEGNLVVIPDDNTLMSKVTIEKPENLSSENIRYNKNIAGIDGSFIGDVESVEVELFFEGENNTQTVSPSEYGKVFTDVIIKKPDDLKPANIPKGMYIAGVGPGEFAGGGSEDFDFYDENLKFFAYQVDKITRTLTIFQILYNVIYDITGSYDINIPDTIGGYDVVLACR